MKVRLKLRTSSSKLLLATCLVCLSATAQAQDNLLVPSPTAPPPLRFISGNERSQLASARDSKARMKASLEMAEYRLLRAEQFTADQRFINATAELGVYQALIENTLRFLAGEKANSNKTRDLYKRLEIELREHVTRLEAIRRMTPTEYSFHVKGITDFADDARTAALNSFFSDTVLKRDPESPDTAQDSSSSSQPKKQP